MLSCPALLSLLLVLLQVDPRLLSETWHAEEHWADTHDKPLLISHGDDGEGGGVSTFHWDSAGRIKFDRTDGAPVVWMGYRLLTLAVDADVEQIDHNFTDLALALAVRPGIEGLTLSAGWGTANDGLFGDRSTYYGTGTIDYRVEPGLHAGLSYDGNRTLLPQIPLPYLSWEAAPGPDLKLTLGTLESSAVWTPWSFVSISARWGWPTDGSLHAELLLHPKFRFYVEAARRIDGFHQRDHERTRTFYQLHTAEAGLRWIASWVDISLGGGLAFGQRYFEGSDLRDREELAEPESRPFVALTIQGTF